MGTRFIHYADSLYRDLGLSPYRKKSFFRCVLLCEAFAHSVSHAHSEYFEPYHSWDYYSPELFAGHKPVPAPAGLVQPEVHGK